MQPFYQDRWNTIYHGHVLDVLRKMPPRSVQMCVTSPPYWGLRAYQTDPVIWSGNPDCDHTWIATTLQKIGRDNGYYGGEVGGKEWSKQKRTSAASAFCDRCGAWLGELGSEPTPDLYVLHLVQVFREVWRVLRDDGVVWLNLGDTFYSGNRGSPSDEYRSQYSPKQTTPGYHYAQQPNRKPVLGFKPKDLCMIPARVALALQADGWWVRCDIAWEKPNTLPESVKDRPVKSHEYIFLLAKSGSAQYWTHPRKQGTRRKPFPDCIYEHRRTGERVDYPPVSERIRKCFWKRKNLWEGHDYFYDAEAIKEPASPDTHARYACGLSGNHKWADGGPGNQTVAKTLDHLHQPGVHPKSAAPGSGIRANASFEFAVKDVVPYRNKRSVWSISTEGFADAHFAIFPKKLVLPCIQAGTSEYGCCAECGAPYARILSEGFTAHTGQTATHYSLHSTAGRLAQLRQASRESGIEYVDTRQTIGWIKTCECTSRERTPCTVLDPFMGRGTTLLVSKKLQRRGIGIDISEAYCHMAVKYLNPPQIELDFARP